MRGERAVMIMSVSVRRGHTHTDPPRSKRKGGGGGLRAAHHGSKQV